MNLHDNVMFGIKRIRDCTDKELLQLRQANKNLFEVWRLAVGEIEQRRIERIRKESK